MENRFNLIDEPWISIVDHGRVSLSDIFSENNYQYLGGNPVQKTAVFKLLLAIAQAAATPEDEQSWRTLGAKGMAQQCLNYLNKWHDHFYLYGKRPFLQIPEVQHAKTQSIGAFLPEVSTGNTTVLTQFQIEKKFSDADKAIILLTQMGFALGGKKVDNSMVLSPNYSGKSRSGKPGPSVGHMGLLHHFVMANSLQDSIWLNLMSAQNISLIGMYRAGIGQAPWERMPTGEACEVSEQLQNSYMGRLIPLCRFCLLTENDMHYTEGIAHDGYKEGVYDLSVAIDNSGKEPRAQWADPEKRPWRELTSLLSFIEQSGAKGFQSWQIRFGLDRARETQDLFSIWSGGLRVSSNAGEQYVSGADDSIESQIWLVSEVLGQTWFEQLKQEMNELESLAKVLYGKVLGYFKVLTVDGKNEAAMATNMFWQLCEHEFQQLLSHCEPTEEDSAQRQLLRRKFAQYQHQTYDFFCPNQSARQLGAWAKNRPSNYKYLNQGAL